MQIKIEIDVKPEELRRFLGLPDVAGLQEDVVQFLREKIGSASESFDPASFVKDNLQHIRNSGAWKKVVAAAKARASSLVPEPEPAPKKRAARKGATAKARPARKRAAQPGAMEGGSASPAAEDSSDS
jgi:beta-phosphoglucomutase-like phosphatase (HAD superfamily)